MAELLKASTSMEHWKKTVGEIPQSFFFRRETQIGEWKRLKSHSSSNEI